MSLGDARVVAAAHQRADREVDERAGGVVVVPGGGGQRERLLEQRAAPLGVGAARAAPSRRS